MESKTYILVEQGAKKRAKARNSLIRQTNTVLGICEQLRFIYDSIYTMPDGELKDRITEQLVDAIIMAKKMDDRLNYYFHTYVDKTGHNASNLIRLQNNNWRIRMRRNRKI